MDRWNIGGNIMIHKVNTGMAGKYIGSSPVDDPDTDMRDLALWLVEKQIRRKAAELMDEDLTILNSIPTRKLNVNNHAESDRLHNMSILEGARSIINRPRESHDEDEYIEEICKLADKYIEAAIMELL